MPEQKEPVRGFEMDVPDPMEHAGGGDEPVPAIRKRSKAVEPTAGDFRLIGRDGDRA